MDEATLNQIIAGFREGGDEVIGYRRITELISDTPCQDGCLAPGSSPHFHNRVTAWEFIGSTHILTIDREGMAIHDSMVSPVDVFLTREVESLKPAV